MRTVTRRIGRLEDRFSPGSGKRQCILLVVCKAGWGLALDRDACIQILRECGFLPTGPVGLVNLCQVPDGLNAEELDRHLRDNGAETRSFYDPLNSDEPQAQASARLRESGGGASDDRQVS